MPKERTSGLNVKVLEDKEVLFHFGDDPVIDIATGTFGPDWRPGGVEPNDSTWELTREITSNKTNMTGGQTSTSHQAGGLTGAASIIPGSAAMDHIEWPDTVVKDGVLIRKHNNIVAAAHVARVHKFQGGVTGIAVSREKAYLLVNQRTQGNDPAGRAIAIDYVNGGDEGAFEEMYYHVDGAGTVTNVEPKIFKSIEDLEAKVAAGDAFKSAAAKGNLTAMVPTTVTSGDATLREFSKPDTSGGTESGE